MVVKIKVISAYQRFFLTGMDQGISVALLWRETRAPRENPIR